jgi:hypothetical protein
VLNNVKYGAVESQGFLTAKEGDRDIAMIQEVGDIDLRR